MEARLSSSITICIKIGTQDGFQEVPFLGAAEKADFMYILSGFGGAWPCVLQVVGSRVGVLQVSW